MVDLNLWTIVLLAGAGFAAGAINAAAGGGSLVTFPVLVAIGYPPLIANITNNVAVSPGYITGAFGYRQGLRGQGHRILPLAVASVVGTLIGVGLILASSRDAFTAVVPFLVLAACALLTVQPWIASKLKQSSSTSERPGIWVLTGQTLAAIYGGYFGAALGVALIAILGVFFDDTLQRLNALKALMSLVIGGVAALVFALLAPVAWSAALIVGPASLAGGQVGAILAQQVSNRILRAGIITYGVAAAIWLFLR